MENVSVYFVNNNILIIERLFILEIVWDIKCNQFIYSIPNFYYSDILCFKLFLKKKISFNSHTSFFFSISLFFPK